MQNVLILGATSAIAQATAQLLAQRGVSLFLVGRDAARLDAVADDLRVRGAGQVETLAIDLTDHDRHDEIVTAALDRYPDLDTALIAHGVLPDQKACERSAAAALESVDTNFLSVIGLVTPLATHFEQRRRGTIAVISSVAGDRGRQSNYVYGAAKSGLDTFLQGLRNRLCKAGVRVITIKPGFVATPMTAHLERSGPLWAEPHEVATGIVRALDKGADVVYLPRIWSVIMLVIRSIPEWIFKRLSL